MEHDFGVIRLRSALLAASLLALAGCHSVPKPTPEVAVEVVGGKSAVALPLSAPLLGDARPLELAAFEVPREERERFEKERSEWVRQQAADGTSSMFRGLGRGIEPLCLVPPPIVSCLAFLGVEAALVGVVAAALYPFRLGSASMSWDGPTLIPAKEGAQVSDFFRGEATGGSLAERIDRLNGSQARGDEYPRLVVRMKSARLVSYGPALRVSMTASAQALESREDQTAPTEHTADFIIARDKERLAKGVDNALDVLARNISATYFPGGREASWAKVRGTRDPEELRRYIAADPAGPYAKEADVRIAALYREQCPQPPAPLAVPFDLAPGAELPRAGSTFTYRVAGGPVTHTYRVKSATPRYIVEEYMTSDWCTREWHHTGGAYIADEGISVFSPYLGITTDLKPSQADWQLPAHTCVEGICNSRIRVLGVETVEVPAGRFEATKVEVEHTWGRAGLFRRTMTAWYVPAVRRAVKFSSTSGLDLELVSYELK